MGRRERNLWIIIAVESIILVAASIIFKDHISPAISVLVSALVFAANFYFYIRIRENRLHQLAGQITSLLSGAKSIEISDLEEGALSILEVQINKLVRHLTEYQNLLQKEKLNLASYIADISHQIRTPLTSINIIISLLGSSNTSSERKLELLSELSQLHSIIDWQVSTLLRLSRLDAGAAEFNIKQHSLSTLVSRATEPLLIQLDLSEVNLDISVSGSFSGDINWSTEALTNIVKNCLEHSPQGGTIYIEGEENPIHSVIRITDEGPGIAAADRHKIFSRFYKGSGSSNTGFGIGLSLARKVQTLQGGTLSAKNSVVDGRGAQFEMKFIKRII